MPAIARLGRALPLVAGAVLGAYGLVVGAGGFGVFLLVVILGLAGTIVFHARRAEEAAMAILGRSATAFVLASPGVLVVFFSFSSGGFFPDSVAIGALALAAILAVRLGLAERPLAALGPAALVPLVGLAGFAGWALLSQVWSHAPGRATISFDRDLLYLLAFALFASLGRSRARIGWAVRWMALAMALVAAVSLISRMAPDVLSTPVDTAADSRLAYPLTYWNALGLLCALGGILCLHLACADERRLVRVLGAAAVPVLGTTLLLTYSRGALAVAVVGLVLYAVLGRARGLLAALTAIAPGTAVAVKVAYDDTLLSSANPTTPTAVHQGHELALVVGCCVASAVALRFGLLRLDAYLDGERSPIDRHRRGLRNAAIGGAVAVIAVAIALGAPGAISHRWNQFVNQPAPTAGGPTRNRLTSASADGRIQLWKIALDAFDQHPLDGTGAETYQILYYEHRTQDTVVVNAHSLYIETLGELGIVGLVLLALYVLGTLVGLAPRGRGRDRPLYAALFACGLMWALHASVDWDWQMPAVSLPFAALGGLALGRPVWRERSALRWPTLLAFAAGAIVVVAAVAPALVLASQVRLNDATTAFADGNCASATQFARESLDALGTRAPPWQIEALCSLRAGAYQRADMQLRAGLAQDPNDWQLESELAASLAAAGRDARAEAARALVLNPIDPNVQELASALAQGPSHRARRAALAFLSQQSLIESG